MLELYEPHIEDLWFKEKMMSDEQTMSYKLDQFQFICVRKNES